MIRIFLIIYILNFLNSQTIDDFKEYKSQQNSINKEDYNILPHNVSFGNDLLENSIDPKEYLIGPGDVFAFNMLSSDGVINFNLTVNPVGKILIPAIGIIDVNNISLEKTIQLIKKESSKKYPNANMHVVLIKLRSFKVQVIGVNNIDSYVEASAVMRVSDVLKNIYEEYNNSLGLDISERNIQILRIDDSIINVDLLSFRQFGDKTKNPTLNQGDIIKLSLQENYVGLYGGIKIPGRYEIVENENLYQLIELAGGFTKNADLNNIEITRFINDIDKKIINLTNKIDLKKILIKDEDHIIVRYKQDYKRQDLVTIDGEVKYPGIYSISHNATTLSELIDKCGGLSSKADISKIMINNKYISNFEDLELNRINLIPEEYRSDEEKSYIKARARSPKGNLNSSDIKFTQRIMSFKLNRNDLVTIPQEVDYIEVLGGVFYPGRYPFYNDYSLNDYIELAGGLTETAKSKKFIVKNNNGQKIPFNKKINIENGDTIFIPEKIEYSIWDRFKEIITVLSQIATLFVVLQSSGS